MRTSPDALQAGLGRGLRSAYLVTGAEPLLIAESAAAIRQAARAAGCADREVHFIERSFDWDELLRSSANLSLFGSRRLIELRFSSTPDAEAQRTLAGLAATPPVDAVLLVCRRTGSKASRGRLGHGVRAERRARGDRAGRTRRAAGLGPRRAHWGGIDSAAARVLADRVEGNLLAAQQEVERIALLMPGATLGAEDVARLVADSARYDVFELSAAAFAGQPERALRILAGLRGEGREPPLVLWALLNDLRALSRVMQRLLRERSPDDAFRAEHVWSNRQGPLRAALGRFDRGGIDSLLMAALAPTGSPREACAATPGIEMALWPRAVCREALPLALTG